MLRVVVDTNVFLRSLLSRKGTSSKVVDEWRAGKCLLVTAPSIISEIRRVLTTPRIRKKYRIGEEEIEQLIDLLKKVAVVIPGSPGVKGVTPRDPEDDKFLAFAIEAGADFIVSGDRHLLGLGEHRGIPTNTLQEFMKKLSASICLPPGPPLVIFQPLEKIPPVLRILEDLSALDPPDHDMVENTGSIKAS